MNSLLIIFITFFGYIIAYKTYGKFIAYKIFKISNSSKMPSHQFKDGVDYIPTKKHIVLGHHFTTISGLGPIVGPAIGIIWGWVPALLWIFFGSIFMGAVHDFSTMVISARAEGKSLGDLTGDIISPSTRVAFQVVIQFLLWIVIGIFAMIVGVLFHLYPHAVFPVWMEIPIAIWLGWQIRKGGNDLILSIIAVVIMYITVVVGYYLPIKIPAVMGSDITTWTIILLIYSFIASTVAVDKLLQPRDYINSHQLIVAMVILVIAIIVAHPTMSAPAINSAAFKGGTDIPSLVPLLFITIACGAISGFHSLASSGTTVKQVDKEEDSLAIGYGGMILEGVLGVIVIVVIAGGLGLGLEKGGVTFFGVDAFNNHYQSWSGASGLGAKIAAFITGAANIMASIGLPKGISATIMAVFIVSFAGTTLDSATRIQRLSLQELFKNRKGETIKPLNNRYIATFVVVFLAFILVFLKPGSKGALILWPMFGALNQLLAALGLLIVTVYLIKKGKNYFISLIPMIFMFVMTVWATVYNIKKFIGKNDYLLTTLSIIILILSLWLVVGAVLSIKNRKIINN